MFFYNLSIDKKQFIDYTMCKTIDTKELTMNKKEIENWADELITEWAMEELEFEQDRRLILYTKEQKEAFKQELIENGFPKEVIDILDERIEKLVIEREEYFSSDKPLEFKGGVEWETMEEWFEDVEYEFKEVA